MTTVDNKNAACILYVDHQGHPAPLSECFHATASRRLSSTVDRQGRPSTITQVDSAYCPQCLSFHDATSGSQLGFCPKPTCLQCPLCASIVSCSLLQEGEGCFGYTCGKCDWNSTQCNLTIKTSSTEATKEEMTEASTKLFEQLEQKRQLMKKPIEDHYRKMVAAWEGKLKPSASAAAAFQSTKCRQEEAWSVAALETAMDKKKHDIVNSLSANIGGLELQKISLEDEIPLDSTLQDQPIASLALQARMGLPASSMLDLLPLSVPLRPRKSRRCRAELSEGKPGILLKPKLNPLEGDSSLRTGHGQWWKKDSSAVHVVPRLIVVRYGSTDTQQHAFLLKVTNPTLGLVRLQISVSMSYGGEPYWEDETNTNPLMDHLLAETVSNKHVNVLLLRPASPSDSVKSEMVDVESAEDTLVDIGKVREIPEPVLQWDAEKAIAAEPPSLDALQDNQAVISSVKLLANNAGSAWFQLICGTKLSDNKKQNLFRAIPLSLQIEVGNGSWESSLIQAKTESAEKDLVSFDVVLTWPVEDTTSN